MAWVLFFALLLDAALGEPNWLWWRLPHPAVLMGRAVTLCASTLNHGRYKKIKGALTLIFLIVLGACLGQILGFFGPVAEVLCAAVLLAQKSLVQHVRAVSNGARYSLHEGRRAVAMTTESVEPNYHHPRERESARRPRITQRAQLDTAAG